MLGKRRARIGLTTLIVALVLTSVGSFFVFSGKSSDVTAAEDCQSFPETGFQVCGRFLTYWKANGGLAQQGFPISDVFEELNQPPPAGDGKVHKVQYFQRARFEQHLENQPPYDVLLGLLGAEQLKAKFGAQPAPGTPLLVVNEKRTQAKIDSYDAKAGFTYLIVDITVTNTLGKPLDISPGYFKVQSDHGFSYGYATPTFRLSKELTSTKLAPGESTRGELAFEVPTNEVIKSVRFEDYNNKITVPIS
ncbi:MAG: hypothetical protein JWP00_2623 [Chloroflexi bacterium]|nr:hypothetical protein [Chloroflexota bacterium]